MRNLRTAFVLFAALALASCVTSPFSRSPADSLQPVTLSGYVLGKHDTVIIKAINQNTGIAEQVGSAVSDDVGITRTNATNTTYTLFHWTWTYPNNGGVLPAQYWSPQSIVGVLPSSAIYDLKTAQGHAELLAFVNGVPLDTFSAGAAQAAANSNADLTTGSRFSDGQSVVLFDQNGTGSPAHGPWMNVAGMKMTPPGSGFLPVAWSAGYYQVEGSKKVYGLVCAPTTGGPYPIVIYNHGGIDAPLSPTAGDLFGNIASGWTMQPSNGVDSLGQCLDWAKRGWVFATSAYRGSSVTISGSTVVNAKSDGNPEFCLGEVTDVLALTDLVMNGAVTVGPPGSAVTPNIGSKKTMFMFGYSHGGCVTWRAVEQGAPVKAFSVIEGFTDMRLTYLTARKANVDPATSAALSGAFQAGTTTTFQPDAAGVMGYNWRSAHYFASRGDLGIQQFKAMPILILHGDNEIDVDPTTQATSPNPTPLGHPALISPDIGATNIFIGPSALAPTSEPCISGQPGAAVSTLNKPDKSCPIVFTAMDTSDSCTNGALWFLTQCAAITLPLTPAAGQPVQQHYLVVYHNMNHINGGLGILATFGKWVKTIFAHQAGCDGLVINCAND